MLSPAWSQPAAACDTFAAAAAAAVGSAPLSADATPPAGAVLHRVAPEAALWLLPERAAFDPDRRLLFVADLHLGKAASFRRLGVPVPEATTDETLALLQALVRALRPAEIVFLGDFLHSERWDAQATHASMADWRARHAALPLTLVRGNHDRRAGDPPAAWGLAVVEAPLRRGPWTLVHAPEEAESCLEGYALAGHVHPAVSLAGRGGDRLRLPCFHFGPRLGLLPAFGAFTGMHTLNLAAERGRARCYAVAGARVCALP